MRPFAELRSEPFPVFKLVVMTSDKRQTPPALDPVCHPTGSVAMATRRDHPSLWG